MQTPCWLRRLLPFLMILLQLTFFGLFLKACGSGGGGSPVSVAPSQQTQSVQVQDLPLLSAEAGIFSLDHEISATVAGQLRVHVSSSDPLPDSLEINGIRYVRLPLEVVPGFSSFSAEYDSALKTLDAVNEIKLTGVNQAQIQVETVPSGISESGEALSLIYQGNASTVTFIDFVLVYALTQLPVSARTASNIAVMANNVFPTGNVSAGSMNPLPTGENSNYVVRSPLPPSEPDFLDAIVVYAATQLPQSARTKANLAAVANSVFPTGNLTAANISRIPGEGTGTTPSPSPTSNPGVLADSVAEFSNVQGANNWFYGYYDKTADPDGIYTPNEFIQLPRFVPNGTFIPVVNQGNTPTDGWLLSPSFGNPFWVSINAQGQHPTGVNTQGKEHWAIRRWVSDYSGPVTISGQLSVFSGGDGTEGSIYVDGSRVFNRVVNSATDFNYSVNVTLSQGSEIDFVVTPRANDVGDNTKFLVNIKANVGIACTNPILSKNTAIPTELVEISGIPTGSNLTALISDKSSDVKLETLLSPLQNGNTSILVPPFPNDPMQGGSVDVIISSDSFICPPLSLQIEALPDNPGGLDKLEKDLQLLVNVTSQAYGIDPATLQGEPGSIPEDLLPLVFVQWLISNPRNPDSLQRILDGTAPILEDQEIDKDLLNGLIRVTNLDNLLEQYISELQAISLTYSSGLLSQQQNATETTNQTVSLLTFITLPYTTDLLSSTMRGQASLDDLLNSELYQNIQFAISVVAAIAGIFPGAGQTASLAITIYNLIASESLKFLANVLPSELIHPDTHEKNQLKVDVSTLVIISGQTANWSASVKGLGKQYELDLTTIVNVFLSLLGVAQNPGLKKIEAQFTIALSNIINSFLSAYLPGSIIPGLPLVFSQLMIDGYSL